MLAKTLLALKNFTLSTRLTLLLLIIFLGGIVLSGITLSNVLNYQAQNEITSKAILLMQTMNSVKHYTNTQISPKLTEKLETEFSPQSIPAYSAREVFETIKTNNNSYHDFNYKDAMLNPSNPRDKVDSFETKIVQSFRNDKSLKELRGFRSLGGENLFYIAHPIVITDATCLKCHDRPEITPKSVIKIYGAKNGMGWKLQEIIGTQMISVPANQIFQNARQSFVSVIGIVAIVFAVALSITDFWLKKYIIRPIIKQIVQVTEGGHSGNEVLVEKLTPSDIDWAIANGHNQQVVAGTILIQQYSNLDNLYIVLEGTLSATTQRHQENVLASTLTNPENNNVGQEIFRFFKGDIIGEISLLNLRPSAITVKAIENSLVLALPQKKLQARLKRDLDFASRFYRAIAILLLDRNEQLLKQFISHQNLAIPLEKNIPLLFGELGDSDVDWMVEHGSVQEITSGTVMIQAGLRVDNLYILLEGSVSVFLSEDTGNSTIRAFGIDNQDRGDEPPGYEIAQVYRGEFIGEMALLDTRLPIYTFKARENLRVLAINRQQLIIKLEENAAMGARFNRVLAMLLSEKLQQLISQLEYGSSDDTAMQTLAEDHEDEINLDVIDNMIIGCARFDWMLKRLSVIS